MKSGYTETQSACLLSRMVRYSILYTIFSASPRRRMTSNPVSELASTGGFSANAVPKPLLPPCCYYTLAGYGQCKVDTRSLSLLPSQLNSDNSRSRFIGIDAGLYFTFPRNHCGQPYPALRKRLNIAINEEVGKISTCSCME